LADGIKVSSRQSPEQLIGQVKEVELIADFGTSGRSKSNFGELVGCMTNSGTAVQSIMSSYGGHIFSLRRRNSFLV
jgi:hypothetical protein